MVPDPSDLHGASSILLKHKDGGSSLSGAKAAPVRIAKTNHNSVEREDQKVGNQYAHARHGAGVATANNSPRQPLNYFKGKQPKIPDSQMHLGSKLYQVASSQERQALAPPARSQDSLVPQTPSQFQPRDEARLKKHFEFSG